MNQLNTLHATYSERGRLFAQDQADILNSFDLMDEGDNPIKPLYTELSIELEQLEMRLQVWLANVFEGNSSSFAITKILESNNAQQLRLKLKW